MSIISSLYVGASGLRSNEDAIGIIGDNLANMNTIGFKSSRGSFADVLHQTVIGGGGFQQIGQGSRLQAIQRLHTQGALLATNVSTDAAVAGNGFFLVEGQVAGTDATFYTRNGQFEFDSEGYLVTTTGLRLQGFQADAAGQMTPTIGDLQIGGQVSAPNQTTLVELGLNLDASTPINPTGFDLNDPAGTADFSTTVTVHDSLGAPHQVDVYFVKTDNNVWEWHAVVDGAELAGGVPGDPPIEIADGTLDFTSDGQLDIEGINNSTISWFNASTPQDIDWDFGDSLTTDVGAGTGTTQFAATNSINAVDQDGFGSGVFQFFRIDPDGTVIGAFSNGEIRPLGQVVLATFNSPESLDARGGNLYLQTVASGEPVVGAPETGGRGAVFGATLEQSNVDIAAEFTQMIVSQRAFQASSRTIVTADQMLAEAVNLKR